MPSHIVLPPDRGATIVLPPDRGAIASKHLIASDRCAIASYQLIASRSRPVPLKWLEQTLVSFIQSTAEPPVCGATGWLCDSVITIHAAIFGSVTSIEARDIDD